MHDALLVGGGQAAGDLERVVQCPGHGQPSFHGVRQALPFEQLHHEVGGAVARAHVEHREDVGMVEGGGRARLLLEAADAVRAGGDLGGKDLHRDLAPQPCVAGTVDLAHAAGSEEAQHLVGPQPHPGGQARALLRRCGTVTCRGEAGRGSEKLARLVVRGEQRVHLAPQVGIAPARRLQEGLPARRRLLERGMEDSLGLLPAVGHGRWCGEPPGSVGTGGCQVKDTGEA